MLYNKKFRLFFFTINYKYTFRLLLILLTANMLIHWCFLAYVNKKSLVTWEWLTAASNLSTLLYGIYSKCTLLYIPNIAVYIQSKFVQKGVVVYDYDFHMRDSYESRSRITRNRICQRLRICVWTKDSLIFFQDLSIEL